MAEQTPGNWEVQEPFRGKVSGPSIWCDGMLIAQVAGLAPFDYANADLIAAAPETKAHRDELLAACKSALEWVARNTPMVDSADPVLGPIADESDRVRAVLRAAIARAEARHPNEQARPIPEPEE